MKAASIFSPSWVEPLGWALVHFLWQGALIAKAFAVARALGGRSLSPHARYSMACAALAAMMLAPIVTFILLANSSGLHDGSGGWAGRPLVSALASGAPAVLAEWGGAVPWLTRAFAGQLFPWLVNAWACGSLAFSVRLIGGMASASRLRSRRFACPAPAGWQSRLERLMERMGVSRRVELLVSSLAQTPAAIGYLAPVIVMPLSALSGLPVEQVESLLAHELAHIRRADYLVNLLQSLAEAILFYHPSVWWLSNEIRVERELCCDDIAVEVSGDVLTYARALVAVESTHPRRLRAAVAANGGSLARRIGRLLDPAQARGQTRAGSGAAAALSILLVAAAAAAMNRQTAPLEPLVVAAPLPQQIQLSPVETSIPRSVLKKKRGQTGPSPGARQDRQARSSEEPSVPLVREEPRRGFAFISTESFGEPVLDRIEFRGMTEDSARALRERLPLREGRRIARWMRERLSNVEVEYGTRLEFRFFLDSEGGVVLRIHPPGLANGEPLQLERREQLEKMETRRDEPREIRKDQP